VETAQIFIRQYVVYPYSGILGHLVKEWCLDVFQGVSESHKHPVMEKKPDPRGHVLHDSISMKWPQQGTLQGQSQGLEAREWEWS
jgi:hypothetical protein